MKRFFLIFIFLNFLAFSGNYGLSTANSYAGTLDKIIVVVNGETITQGELDAALAAVTGRLESEAGGIPAEKDPEAYKKEILERMIDEKVILSEARKRGIEANDDEIEEKLKEVKSKFESDETFNEALKEQDISLNELKQRYADQVKTAKLVEEQVRKKITVTPSEISQYYENHKDEVRQAAQVRMRNILIKPQSSEKDEEARALAEKILGFLRAGENFDELALKYSKGPNADRGGDMGFVKKGQMIKPIEEAVFNLQAGQLSDVIKTDLGYHIFRVDEKKPEGVRPLEEVRADIEKILYFEKGKDIYNKWMAELRKNAYISFR